MSPFWGCFRRRRGSTSVEVFPLFHPILSEKNCRQDINGSTVGGSYADVGLWYPHKQRLSAGSLINTPSKRNHVRTVLPGMMCAVSIRWLFAQLSCTERYEKRPFRSYLLSSWEMYEYIHTWYFEESMHVFLWSTRNVHSTYYMLHDGYFSGWCFSERSTENLL